MKTRESAVLITSVFLMSGCSTHWSPATQLGLSTSVKVTGTVGAPVFGHYVQHGVRAAFTNTIPFVLTQRGISEVELRKGRREDDLRATARSGYDSASSTAPPGTPGLRVVVGRDVGIQSLED
jgi:hypothetical protein